jgi:NADH dehydrogenase
MPKKILIIGGGFGGIRTAMDLARKKLPNTKITLISDKNHFEYYPALYRIVTGKSPLEVCVPLSEIFMNTPVEIIRDKINRIDIKKKILKGESGSDYTFDFLVLSLGSETAYFNVPGLPDLAFGFKSINEALKLKRHLHNLFEEHEGKSREEIVSRMHILVVGGGPTGVEVAGELSEYLSKLALKHKIDPMLVTIDLIEAAPRLLPALSPDVSKKVMDRLHSLGINIFLNRAIIQEDIEQVYLKDMSMKTKTVIWTAGTRTHHLYGEIEGLEFAKNRRVLVDKSLQAKGFENIFIIGDAADTPFSGLAQTAIYDASIAADCIERKINGREMPEYLPKKVSYAIPVGPGWAAVDFKGFKFYGRIAWWLRRLVDLKFFLSILPFSKALRAFEVGKKLCESCDTCLHYESEPEKK